MVLLFPDNTVLINFAYLHRMDLLERLARNGAWCGTVAHECQQSARLPDLEDMAFAHGIFGEPLRPETPVEHVMVRTYQTRLARPGDRPNQNLGEAETLALIDCRSLQAIFVTDDSSVARVLDSSSSRPRITVVSTWDLLRLAARSNFVDPDTLWSYVLILRRKGRHRPLGVTDRASFDAWLSA